MFLYLFDLMSLCLLFSSYFSGFSLDSDADIFFLSYVGKVFFKLDFDTTMLWFLFIFDRCFSIMHLCFLFKGFLITSFTPLYNEVSFWFMCPCVGRDYESVRFVQKNFFLVYLPFHY